MNQPASVSRLAADLTGEMPAGSPQHKPDTPPQEGGAGPAEQGAAPPATSVPPAGAGKSKPGKAGKGGKSKEKRDPAEFAHLRDKHGFAFDPAVHKTKPDGSPLLTSDNRLWRKSGVRPKQSKSFVGAGPIPPGAPGAAPDAQPAPGTEAAHYQASGQVMAETLTGVCAMLGGEDWHAAEHEKAALANAWGNYFRSKGLTDIPPGVAVLIATGGYLLPRLSKPTTRGKLARLVQRFRDRKRKAAPTVSANEQGSSAGAV